MKLTRPQREELRMKFGGRCAYCGCELPEKGWHADHVEPVMREWWKSLPSYKEHPYKWEFSEERRCMVKVPVPLAKPGFERPENDTIANLFPSCRACNIDKHCTPLELWRKQMQDRVAVCRRNYSAFRHAERFGLVQEIKKSIVFWFEQYQGKCDGNATVTPGREPSTSIHSDNVLTQNGSSTG